MNLVRIEAKDGIVFTVERNTAESIRLIAEMLEFYGFSGDDDETIPLQQIDSNVLEAILKWAEFHQSEEQSEEYCRCFNRHFLAENKNILHKVISIAKFLGCQPLFELICKHMVLEILGE